MELTREETHSLLGRAEVAVVLEEYDRAVALIEEALRVPPHRNCNRCQPSSLTRLALCRAWRDGFHRKDLEDADAALAALKALGLKGENVQLRRAQLLCLAGDGAGATASAEAVRLEAQQIENRLLEADSVCVKAKIADERGVFDPDLGPQLWDALRLYREMGHKLREPFVYLYYGLWLARSGDAARALYVLGQGFRFCELLGFSTMGARILAAEVAVVRATGDGPALSEREQRLDAYLAGHPDMSAFVRDSVAAARGRTIGVPVGEGQGGVVAATSVHGGTAEPPGAALSAAWLQPLQAESVRVGDTAGTRFSLQNLAGQTVHGRLGFGGAVIQDYSWDGALLRVRLDKAGVAARAAAEDLPVTLPADCLYWLDLTLGGGDGTARETVELLWNDETHAVWSLGPRQEIPRVRVMNSGLYALGPFVRIPVAHLLVSPHPGETLVNLRAVASEPFRVEFIDSGSGRILGVDANGNGGFGDVGDDLWSDADADGFPDLRLPADGKPAVVELWLYPCRSRANGGAWSDNLSEVSLYLRSDGDWEKQATDHVLGAGE